MKDGQDEDDGVQAKHWKQCRTLVEAYRDKCARARDYEEAAVAEARLAELKKGEADWRRETTWREHMLRAGLQTNADTARLAVAEAQAAEQRAFAEEWAQRFEDFDTQAPILQQEFKKWQDEDRKAQRFEDVSQKREFRPTREVMQLRKKEAALVQQERYSEAAKAKATIEQLHARQRAKLAARAEEQPVLRFAERQHAELQAFQAKLQTKREKLAATQTTELEQLMQHQSTARLKMEAAYRQAQRIGGGPRAEISECTEESSGQFPNNSQLPKRVRSASRCRSQLKSSANGGRAALSRPQSASQLGAVVRASSRPASAVSGSRAVRRPASAAAVRPVFSTAVRNAPCPFFRGCSS